MKSKKPENYKLKTMSTENTEERNTYLTLRILQNFVIKEINTLKADGSWNERHIDTEVLLVQSYVHE